MIRFIGGFVYSGFLVTIFLLSGCNTPTENEKKVLYINSAHEGDVKSDAVTDGIKKVLNQKSVPLKAYYLDSKRNPSTKHLSNAISEVQEIIDDYEPNLVITHGDNAIKYLVIPYLLNKDLPIIFCGVYWTAEPYDLSDEQITGIVEVPPIQEAILNIQGFYPESNHLYIISENTMSALKNIRQIDEIIFYMDTINLTVRMANNFEDWKVAIKEANNNGDIIYLPGYKRMKNWNIKEAEKFIEREIKKPIITCNPQMMSLSVYGLTILQEEQGILAAQKALEVLAGEDPTSIPLENKIKTKAFFNKRLAQKIGLNPGPDFLENCEILDK